MCIPKSISIAISVFIWMYLYLSLLVLFRMYARVILEGKGVVNGLYVRLVHNGIHRVIWSCLLFVVESDSGGQTRSGRPVRVLQRHSQVEDSI